MRYSHLSPDARGEGHTFTPPPRAWLVGRVAKLDDLLAQRTEPSAPALRGLTGPVTLTPERPDVGRPLFPGALFFRESEPARYGGWFKFIAMVEAPGIEADQRQLPDPIEQQSGAIRTGADPADVSDRAPRCAIVHGVVTESSEAYELSNVVETPLARALVLAAEAKRWDVVAQITAELEGRRVGVSRTRRLAKGSR